jgi:hypothetical protein
MVGRTRKCYFWDVGVLRSVKGFLHRTGTELKVMIVRQADFVHRTGTELYMTGMQVFGRRYSGMHRRHSGMHRSHAGDGLQYRYTTSTGTTFVRYCDPRSRQRQPGTTVDDAENIDRLNKYYLGRVKSSIFILTLYWLVLFMGSPELH